MSDGIILSMRISDFYIHNNSKYSLLITRKKDNTRILGDIKGNLILHSNIEKLRIKPIKSSFSVYFKYRGNFEFIRFRITTTKPDEDYQDIILYGSDKEKEVRLYVEDFNLEDFIVFDFGVYGSATDIFISDIQIDFQAIKARTKIYSNLIMKYRRKYLLKDYEMLMAPEPHSQERALAVLEMLNIKKGIETIDLGAGGAPMMAELLLRKGNGTVDCLVYGENDTRKAKRYLEIYKERVKIFKGDLTVRETLPNKKYDQILLLDVLEHIEDEKLVLNNIKHLFHEKSILIITVPNINYKDVMSLEFHEFIGHVREGYTMENLVHILNENGLEVIEKFNFSETNKEFYSLWYGELKAWRDSYQYSELAYKFVYDNFSPVKEKLNGSLGISNCIICKIHNNKVD